MSIAAVVYVLGIGAKPRQNNLRTHCIYAEVHWFIVGFIFPLTTRHSLNRQHGMEKLTPVDTAVKNLCGRAPVLQDIIGATSRIKTGTRSFNISGTITSSGRSNSSKKFYRVNHFRQHLKHSYMHTSWRPQVASGPTC